LTVYPKESVGKSDAPTFSKRNSAQLTGATGPRRLVDPQVPQEVQRNDGKPKYRPNDTELLM